MSFEYSPYILALIVAALVSGWELFYIWPHREIKGVMMLVFLAAGVAIWSLGYALEIAGADLATKLFWGKFQYFGIATIPVAWLFFALTYTDPSFKLTRRMVGLLTIIPLITILLTLTTELHGLIWKEYSIFREGGFSALQLAHGAWFWVYWVYSQLLLLAGTVILVRSLIRSRGAFRWQRALFFLAVLAPWIGNALYVTGNSPIPHLDLTPFAFTVSVAALVGAIFGFRLVDITPLARDRVVDSMREGMIVLDARANVVDINNAAARMIGVPVANAIGKTAADIFQPWSHLVERFRNVMEAKDEISVGQGAAQRRYEVRLSPLQDQQGQLLGRVIMLRALDDDVPQPRAASYTPAQPLPRVTDAEEDTEKKAAPIWDALISYFFVHIKKDISVPSGVNPVWYRTRERIFTVGARIVSSLGLIALAVAPRNSFSTTVSLVFAALLIILWGLGVARTVKYEFRVMAFLALVYGFALVETLNFGFSVESFIFFLSFVILAAVLTSRYSAIRAFALAVVSLSVFFILIDSGDFIPLMKRLEGVYVPEAGFSSLLVFIASASATNAFIVILLENLNAAWQKEEQASNLLRQERDLLEQRVEERTHDLVGARDEAEKTSNDLRKYYRAIEQSGNTIVITDTQGNIEYANPKFEQTTGHTVAEAKGKNPRILKSGKQSAEYYSQLWKTISGGNVWTGEFLNKRNDGSLYWESATIAPVLDQNGEITNYVAVKEDITEQKILRDQLQNQNDYLSILHQMTLDLLNRRELNDLLQVIVDRSAILLDAPFSELMLEKNGVLMVEAFTGNQPNLKGDYITREQGKLSWQAFDTHQPVVLEDYSTWEYRRDIYDSQELHATADFPVMAADRCLGILALGRSQPEYRFTAEQIEIGILFARLVALVLDNADLYQSALTEIAERKRTETLLQESEARFRQIVENASDIIYRTDATGHFIYANPSALHTMGYTSETEVLGKSFLDLATPEARRKLKQTYDHQFISKTKNTYYEFPAVTTEGQIIWIGQNVQLIMDGEQITGFQAVARNITQLKQVQEALSISRDQALEASQFKSQLLSRVSHELRTPLSSVLGYAELMQHRAFGPISKKQQGAVENIIESAHYLTNIVSDLLDEAQIASRSLSLYREYFDPAKLLEKINTTMPVLAGKKGLAFHAEISPDLPGELYGDINRLQQIVVNLAGNAVKFTKQGEVSVRITRPTPAQWAIEVSDTGAGIPPEEQKNIFEPFRQVNNAITRENRGSGLGLAISKQLIELMGGQITLRSEVGKGSVFTVTLPILNAPGE